MSDSTIKMRIKKETTPVCENQEFSDDPLYMNAENLMNSVEEESLYANSDPKVQVRLITLTTKADRNSLFPKRKPKPLPKPTRTQVLNTNSDTASCKERETDPANKFKSQIDSSDSHTSKSLVDVYEDLDEPIYDDVYDSSSGKSFRTATSLTKLSSLPCVDDTDLYEDVQNECKSLPGFLEAKIRDNFGSRITAFDQPLYHDRFLESRIRNDVQMNHRSDHVPQKPVVESLCRQDSGENESLKSVGSTEKLPRFPSIESHMPEKTIKISGSKTVEERMGVNNSLKGSADSLDHLYDTAEDVKRGWFDASGRHNIDETSESLYDEALPVSGQRASISAQDEVPLYEEATSVNESLVPSRKEPAEPLYDEASPVTRNYVKERAKVEEPLYDEATPVLVNSMKKRTETEEPLYDEARQVTDYYAREQNVAEDLLYDTAVDVNAANLPQSEQLAKSGPVSARGRMENPYRLAVSVRESFKEDSSDEDEPSYFNLLMVKMSLERCNHMFYGNLDSHLTMDSLEKKANRLSRLWGQSPNPMLHARDHHQQLKAVKSDTFVKTAADDFGDFRVEDVDSDVMGSFMSNVAEGDRAMMRKWVIVHILDSERVYLGILNLLFEHMQTFKSVANTDKCVIPAKDNAVIFYKIAELHKSHFQFVNSLGKIVDKWSSTADQEVGAIFQKFAEQEYTIAQEYLKNYQLAVKTVHRCWTEIPVFAELTKVIPVKFGKSETKYSLEELLHKPIVRFQQNTLSMKDLIKSTPLGHPDYDVLQRALKLALNRLSMRVESSFGNSNLERYLVKHSLLVEKVGAVRRLRQLFLFSDVLICAKQRLLSRRRNLYETKWFVPLCDLQLDERFSAQADKQSALLHQQVIDGLEKELVRLQSEVKRSKKFESNSGNQPSRKFDVLQKKIFQQEAALLESSPYLELKISDRMFNRSFVFLMSSDYERTTWKEAISGMVAKVDSSAARITANEVSHLLESQRLPKAIGSILQSKDISLEKERLSGSLKITIHQLLGLTEKIETFCAVEIDSFGHFFMRAKTNQCKSQAPSWEEEFDIDLEGAQTLHLLCYKIGEETDHLLGKCALELSTAWLSETFKEQSIPLTDQVAIVISMQYVPQDKLMRRSLALNKGMFGVPLETIAARENQLVPLIVTSLIEAIEADGLFELGLYRVSGLSSEIQRLKSVFNKSGAAGAALVKNADVNVLTSLLKLFFRELPESLFTDAAYQKLLKGIALADPEAKEKFLVNTLKEVPKCNYATIIFVLDHLIRVYENRDKNKMTLENLATVFGPTMLHPALLEQKPTTMEHRLWLGTNEIAAQATILLLFLKLRLNKHAFLP